MLGFSSYKKHANKFNYIPRYYDPEKEAREQRRAELRGERSDDNSEYRPGKYIRTQREAREARRAGEAGNGHMRLLKMAVIAALIIVFVYLLYPRLVGLFVSASKQGGQSDMELMYGDFDPTAPITVVPNDYVEQE